MKKIIFTTFSVLLLLATANSQITKGNWLMGGSGSYSRLQNEIDGAIHFKQISLQISPSIGYFFSDKFAAGLKPSFIYGSNSATGTVSNRIYSVGPFARYYFLDAEKIFNLFTEGNYAYGKIDGTGDSGGQQLHTFSVAAGPVLYFNNCIGAEFIMAYSTTKVVHFTGRNNELRFGIGFQIHLEKEN